MSDLRLSKFGLLSIPTNMSDTISLISQSKARRGYAARANKQQLAPVSRQVFAATTNWHFCEKAHHPIVMTQLSHYSLVIKRRWPDVPWYILDTSILVLTSKLLW